MGQACRRALLGRDQRRKAEGRGAIAAFSPSGLSLDGPAHVLHRALMQELSYGGHQRLGAAVLVIGR